MNDKEPEFRSSKLKSRFLDTMRQLEGAFNFMSHNKMELVQLVGAIAYLTHRFREDNWHRFYLIERNGLFDAEYYRAQYPDIAVEKSFSSEPAYHCLKFGAGEKREMAFG